MSSPDGKPLTINGWATYAHANFVNQLEALTNEVQAARTNDPENYARKNAAKRLAAIRKLAFEVIPQDPSRPEYRQGGTLGPSHRHWFRAKFFQQYRLFFRYSTKEKTIVLASVNDETTKRAYGSTTDAYKIFRKRLDSGDPPDGWDELMRDAKRNTGRLRKSAGRAKE